MFFSVNSTNCPDVESTVLLGTEIVSPPLVTSATVFVASGLLALLIASATVAAVASRAARAKPVKALRYE